MTKKEAGRLIVFEEKYARRHFLVETEEALHAVALKILRERDAEEWFEEPEEPDKPVEMLLTPEQIASLDASSLKRVEAARRQYEEELVEFRRDTESYKMLRRALDTGDGKLAFRVLTERKDYEYEGWEFEWLEDLDSKREET